MVKLTPELINQSMQYINPCRERELDLRGYKIPQIENLGATLDQFDTIDLSDNDLRKLDGLPYLSRLKCLLLNNNRILRIGEDLHESVPNLNSIILSGNNLQDLGDLEPLARLQNLETLCLLMNPVSTQPHYREYMAWKLPQLRLLDFRKIRQKDRKAAAEFFRSKQGKDLLKDIAKKSKLNVAAHNNELLKLSSNNSTHLANPDDLQRVREAIKRASSLHEVERLSQILQSGQLPDDVQLNSIINNANENGIAMNQNGNRNASMPMEHY